jgi:putative membrane protein insertion efficiency factor
MTATCSHERPHSLPGRAVHAVIRAYQWALAGRVSPCRYDPSCSSYALEALEVHGFVKGSWLSIRRLGRCHPWGGHGWDPVPQRKAA